MANTYTQIHIQAVFAVQNRASLISPTWKDELYRYITGIIQNHGHKLLQINGMPDHVHILFGMRPTQSLSELMQHSEAGFLEMDQPEGLCSRQVLLAGGLWRILLFQR